MPVIDVHHHVWDLSNSDYAWLQAPLWDSIRRNFSYDELRPALRECGVDKTVLVQADNSVSDCLAMQAVAAREDSVAGFVGWVPLETPLHALAALDELGEDAKFVGIRHVLTFESDDDWILRPGVQRSLGELERRGLTLDITTDRLVHLGHVPALARAFPDLRIAINHIGKPPIGARGWEPWAGTLAAAAAFPNVCAKLSGLTTPYRPEWTGEDFRPYVNFALEQFGPQRLMFGSNWPVTLVAGSYRQHWDAIHSVLDGLSASELAAIRGGTAVRFYHLDV